MWHKIEINKTNISKAFACIAIIIFMALMLAKPSFYLQSASKALALFATSLLPSLFPFYFCSLLLTFCGAVNAISKVGGKPISLLYRTKNECAYALFLSLLCGYPVGASTICELYENGILSEQDAKCASAFCQNAGPVFIIGTLGGVIFNNQAIGWIILLSHYLGALLNGLIYRPRKKSANNATNQKSYDSRGKINRIKSRKISTPKVAEDFSQTARVYSSPNDIDNIMSKAISKSTMSMLCVGGYIVICGMLVDTLELIGFSSLLSSVGNIGEPIKAVAYGMIEMTRGAIACASISNIHLSIALTTSIISLGGLSIFLQCYSYLSRCNISFGRLLLYKLTQCVITFPIAFILSFCV